MQIHLSDITDSEGKIIQFSSEVELDKISFQMGEFPILDRSPVELRIANTGNKVLELTGKGSLTVGIPCDRCLEQVSVTIPYDIDRKLDMKQTDKERVENLDENLLNMGKGTSGSKVGTGGMATKLTAAQIASAAGVDMVIANGADFHVIHKITEGRNHGTLFVSQSKEEVYLIDIIDKLL